MFVSEEELPEDVDSLHALVMDLSRRLQNAHHTIEAERRSASQASQQADYYRSRLIEVESSFRVEAGRIRNSEIKFKREKDARRYEENKAKAAGLVEELRIAELDAQIQGIVKTVPIKISRLRTKVSSLDQEQQSLRLFLAQLSEVEAMNEKLVVAAQMNDLATAVSLLQAGADINYIDAAGYLSLHYSCKDGHDDLVLLLLQEGSDFTARLTGHSPLVLAARRGHNNVVKTLLEHGAHVEEKGVAGYPALISALMHDRASTVRLLLEHAKADINAIDLDENTALHHAVRSNSGHAPEMIRYLLDMGADVEKVNRAGQNPLQVALHEKRKAAVEVLTGIKHDEQEGGQKRAESAGRRKGSMVVITAPSTARPARHAAGSGAKASKLIAKPPVNAIPKHKRTDETQNSPPTRKLQPKFSTPVTGLAKGSALEGVGDEAAQEVNKDDSTTSQILSLEERLNFMASTSVASSVTFDPE